MTDDAKLEFLISDFVTSLANLNWAIGEKRTARLLAFLIAIFEKPNAREALITEGLASNNVDRLVALIGQMDAKRTPQPH